MKELEQKRIESPAQIFERVQIFKRFLKEFIYHHKYDFTQKVAIVAHGSFLRSLSGEGVDQTTGFIINSKEFRNCEVYPW